MNIPGFARKLSAAIIFCVFIPCMARASGFQDIYDQKIHSGTGTLQFRVKLLQDISRDPHDHVFLLGVSSDLKEFFRVQIIEDKLIVQRFFGGCVLTVFSVTYDFRPGDWHTLKLAWNMGSTKFYIDDREQDKLGSYEGDDLTNAVADIRIGEESVFQIMDFKSSDRSDINAEPADQEFVQNAACPRLKELIEASPQEVYRGISLQDFPDQGARDKVKAYIDLLPQDFASSIKHVVYVPNERFSKRGEGGLADNETNSLVFNGKYLDDPNVFFHEAAHLYDFKLNINFGVDEDKNEWAAISGAHCYYKGGNLESYYQSYQKTKDANGFLGAQGGQCPSEDMAIWVGTTYDNYLKHKSFESLLLQGDSSGNKSRKKLDFILKKGFITQEIYDAVTR